MRQSLTPPERETVIVFSDDSDMATVTTHQRPILTKLRSNPAAVEVEDLRYGTTDGARFEIPRALISFRSKRRQGGSGNPDALRKAREAQDRS
jgi:hypothetical protein